MPQAWGAVGGAARGLSGYAATALGAGVVLAAGVAARRASRAGSGGMYVGHARRGLVASAPAPTGYPFGAPVGA